MASVPQPVARAPEEHVPSLPHNPSIGGMNVGLMLGSNSRYLGELETAVSRQLWVKLETLAW